MFESKENPLKHVVRAGTALVIAGSLSLAQDSNPPRLSDHSSNSNKPISELIDPFADVALAQSVQVPDATHHLYMPQLENERHLRVVDKEFMLERARPLLNEIGMGKTEIVFHPSFDFLGEEDQEALILGFLKPLQLFTEAHRELSQEPGYVNPFNTKLEKITFFIDPQATHGGYTELKYDANQDYVDSTLGLGTQTESSKMYFVSSNELSHILLNTRDMYIKNPVQAQMIAEAMSNYMSQITVEQADRGHPDIGYTIPPDTLDFVRSLFSSGWFRDYGPGQNKYEVLQSIHLLADFDTINSQYFIEHAGALLEQEIYKNSPHEIAPHNILAYIASTLSAGYVPSSNYQDMHHAIDRAVEKQILPDRNLPPVPDGFHSIATVDGYDLDYEATVGGNTVVGPMIEHISFLQKEGELYMTYGPGIIVNGQTQHYRGEALLGTIPDENIFPFAYGEPYLFGGTHIQWPTVHPDTLPGDTLTYSSIFILPDNSTIQQVNYRMNIQRNIYDTQAQLQLFGVTPETHLVKVDLARTKHGVHRSAIEPAVPQLDELLPEKRGVHRIPLNPTPQQLEQIVASDGEYTTIWYKVSQ